MTNILILYLNSLYNRDLERLIGQADQFLANSFSLTKENIEELINDLVDGSYSEKEFEQDLQVAQNAASTLYKNILEGGDRAPKVWTGSSSILVWLTRNRNRTQGSK